MGLTRIVLNLKSMFRCHFLKHQESKVDEEKYRTMVDDWMFFGSLKEDFVSVALKSLRYTGLQ